MSLHINKFVDRLRSSDHRNQREITLSLSEAKDLHADITKLLLKLQTMQELQELHLAQTMPNATQTQELEVDGGRF